MKSVQTTNDKSENIVQRLLCIFPWLQLGGSDKYHLELLRYFSACGWQVTVVTTLPSTHSWKYLFTPYADAIIDLTQFSPTERTVRLVQIAHACRCTMVFVSNSVFGYHILPYIRAHLRTTTFIDFCHAEELAGEGGYPALSIRYTAYLDAHITASRHLKEWMCERGGESANTYVSTININNVEWDGAVYDQAALQHELSIPEHAIVILYAARLDRGKQPLLALDVMRAVLQQRPDVVFLIAGDGQFAPYVRGFIRAHRLERSIRMLGAQPNTRVRELLAASDILFLPSQMEGIALAIYEAMAMGVVPVSADVGGQRELVTPEVGVLIERGPHQHADYTTALLQLIEHPDILRERSAAARQRIATQFTLEQMGERMTALLALARQRHAADPRPVDAAAALASARAAIAAAEASAAAQTTIDRPLRRWLRERYWQLVEHQAWWLVPLVETLRRDVR